MIGSAVKGVTYNVPDQIETHSSGDACSMDESSSFRSAASANGAAVSESESWGMGFDQSANLAVKFPLGDTGATGSISRELRAQIAFGKSKGAAEYSSASRKDLAFQWEYVATAKSYTGSIRVKNLETRSLDPLGPPV